MKSIQHYYEKADFRLVDLRPGDKITVDDLNDIGFALTIMWKDYCEKQDIVELNEINQKKVTLINKRIPEYLDFINNTIDCKETSEVLMDKFGELFGVLKK